MERPIEIATVVSRPVASILPTFVERRGALLGTVTGEDDDHQRVLVTLTIGPSAVDQGVVCVVSDVHPCASGASMRVQWRPIRHDRWLPTFDGVLAVAGDAHATRVSLTGAYAIPMGTVGAFGDGIVGRRLAKRTLSTVVAGVAAALDGGGPHTGVVVADDSARVS